jgi:exodeoxyribonuclease-3
VVGVQEIKALSEQVNTDSLTALGYRYQYWFSAEKKGYSGVAVFSKIEPDLVDYGFGVEEFDKEGRVLRTDFGDITLLTCYFPSGTSGEERQAAKYRFLDSFYTWVMELKKTRPHIIVMGDYNIAHTAIDIHNPKGNEKTSGYLPEERAWMTKWLTEGGFVDSFRFKNPTEQKYSWWSVRFNSRASNKGWRIDYICTTESLRERIETATIHNEAVHSDHCPCMMRIQN